MQFKQYEQRIRAFDLSQLDTEDCNVELKLTKEPITEEL